MAAVVAAAQLSGHLKKCWLKERECINYSWKESRFFFFFLRGGGAW